MFMVQKKLILIIPLKNTISLKNLALTNPNNAMKKERLTTIRRFYFLTGLSFAKSNNDYGYNITSRFLICEEIVI